MPQAGWRRIRVALLALAIGWPAAGSPAASEKPELWLRAVGFMARQGQWQPVASHARMETLDRKGRIDSVSEEWDRYADDGRGGLKVELLRAQKDGRDVTAEERAKREKAEARRRERPQRSEGFSFSVESPFDSALQARVEARDTAERQTLFGRLCRRCDFTLAPRGGPPGGRKYGPGLKGWAWIEEQEGRPVKIEYTLDPLPRFAKRFWAVIRYEADPNGPWLIRDWSFEGAGGFLFLRKAMRGQITFSEYRPAAPKAP